MFLTHCFEKNGDYFILDVNSGAVHVADRLALDMVKALISVSKFPLTPTPPEELFEALVCVSKKDINDCYEQLYKLYQAGLLFSKDALEHITDKSILTPISPLKSMCFHVAHDCNLRCLYCFAKTGKFGGERSLMSLETAKSGIDFFLANSGSRKNLELDFFGGEPLLAWDTVVETVNYARENGRKLGKEFSFTLTTNGVALDDEKIEFINCEMSNVVLSLDGRKNINDRNRPYPDGRGCYDDIVSKFQKLVKGRTLPNRTDYFVRGTYTAENLDFSDDVFHIASLGFEHISIEPVALPSKHPLAITAKHLPRIAEEYDRLLSRMLSEYEKNKFDFFHFNVDLDGGPCIIKRVRGCGAGNDYAAISPDGKIFPCHRFVGDGKSSPDKWLLADIQKGDTKLDSPLRAYFAETNLYSKSGCEKCFSKFYCSGGCNATNSEFSGDARAVDSVSCELMKMRTECGIAYSYFTNKQ